jgi:hypothetical protein
MNDDILRAVKNGELVLFLGAGASYGCKTSSGTLVPMAAELAEKMASEAGFKYAGEPLDQVYEASREKLGVRLNTLLETNYRHVTPSQEYYRLATYPWRRIYSLNIDDGLDLSLMRNSPQKVNKLSAKDPIVERDPFFDVIDYIKLNGTVDRLQDGIVFSPSEYAQAAVKHLPWYSQCASDFVRSPILFIGTQLNEPLLKYHIERYESLNSETSGISYLICPSATEIQIASLRRYNIVFVAGTMGDFVKWLESSIPVPPKPLEIAKISIPQLSALLSKDDPQKFAKLFEHVTVVSRDRLPPPEIATVNNTIRDFYKGFKPQWSDIVNAIPARLEILDTSIVRIDGLDTSTQNFIPFLGPAGAGKTTLLMQLCWEFSQRPDWDVFFVDAEPASLLATLEAIETSSPHQKILIAIDNLELSTEHIAFALRSDRLKRTLIIGAERESVWNRRGKHVLRDLYLPPTYVRDLTAVDAKRILQRLKLYGSWTRLGKMPEKAQLKELLDRAKKQLLIALMEATLGRGFEQIIENEYAQLDSGEERLFLVTIALVTDRRFEAPLSLIDRALDKMSILRKASTFLQNLAGIVHQNRDGLSARHSVYAKYLIDRVVDPTLVATAINGLLQAFADYESPVIQHVKKNEAALYKSLINHKFLFEALKGNERIVIRTYADLEKKFEKDGLFWLQYGLALRDFGDNEGALEKLKIACAAYPMPHTQHALAQQLLLSAIESEESMKAMSMVDDARRILEKLDEILESDDTYPIITLAEGHTAVLRRHESEIEARSAAKRYALLLENRAKKNPEHTRLQTAYERMFKYASVGVWSGFTSN